MNCSLNDDRIYIFLNSIQLILFVTPLFGKQRVKKQKMISQKIREKFIHIIFNIIILLKKIVLYIHLMINLNLKVSPLNQIRILQHKNN